MHPKLWWKNCGKMLVYLYNMHLFYATWYTCSLAYTAGWRRHCTRLVPIYKQHGERGNVGVVRERERTADDRVIKADLHPPHRARRQATVHPSRLLPMAWASKNLRLLSHPVSIRVIATMLVTRLKWRRCNRFLRQQSHTLRCHTLRCHPSLRCTGDVINNGK